MSKLTNENYGVYVKIVRITAFMLCAALLLSIPAFAHTRGVPRLPEVTLDPIYVMDKGEKVEITLDGFKTYYSNATGGHSSIRSVFAVCAYRAVQSAFTELWGEEIPDRADIAITTALPIPHSFLFLHMVAIGDSSELKGQESLRLIRKADNTAVEDTDFAFLEALSQSASYQDFEYQITRRDTGETIFLTIDKKAFEIDYLALWKKAIFSLPGPMTDVEQRQFSVSYNIANQLMQLEAYEIFSNVYMPVTIKTYLSVALAVVIVGGFLIAVAIAYINEFRRSRRKKRQPIA